jgi:NADPH:quinone reductase-like Zn-dependent oxidoreductase
MKALAIRGYKAPMELIELPRSEPGQGELLIRVRAAGINPLDFKIRDGAMKVLLPFSFPLILGTDLAGDVEAVGPAVTRFTVGDATFARLDNDRIGAFAEYALVRESAAAIIEPVLDKVHSLDAATEAITYVKTGRAVGKVVIRVAD